MYVYFYFMGLCILMMSDVLKVLFERLRLHERCENKKLPRTLNKQQSTSEAVVQYRKRVEINVSTLLLSILTASFHPFRCYRCSCCSCRICTPCQRSSLSIGRWAGRTLSKVNPNLPGTNFQSVTDRSTRSSRHLWMGFSHA